MAHQHRIIRSSAATPATPSSTPHSPLPTPRSIDLPLIIRDSHADFITTDRGNRKQGRVFSQRRNLGNAASHPSTFYIEFPADSEQFHEIDANRVCSTLGDSSARSPFSRAEVARIMELSRPAMDFTSLLTASRPTR